MKCLLFFFLLILGPNIIWASQRCESLLSVHNAKRKSFPRGFWKESKNLDSLVQLILLHRKSAFLADIRRDAFEDFQTALRERFGDVDINGSKIANNVTSLRLSSEWKEALARAGHPKDARELARRQVFQVLQARKDRGLPLSSSEVRLDGGQEFEKILIGVYQSAITPEAFLQRAERAFGSWRQLLSAFGEDPDAKSLKRSALSYSEVRSIFIRLKDEDLKWVKSTFNSKATNAKYVEIIKEVSGRSLTLYQVFRSALGFKKWSEWQKELFPGRGELKRGRVSVSKQEVYDLIKALVHDGRFSLRYNSMLQNRSAVGLEIVERTCGRKLSLRAFTMAAVRGEDDKKAAWSSLIEEAGLDKNLVLKHRRPLKEKEILDALQVLHRRGVALNTHAIQNDVSESTKSIIRSAIGKARTGKSLYSSALYLGKPWFQWLSDAGFDVTEIQIQGQAPFALVNRVTRRSLSEIQSRKDALLRGAGVEFRGDRVFKIQVEERDPASLLIEKEFSEVFLSFASSLDGTQKELLESFLEGIEQGFSLPELLSGESPYTSDYSSADILELLNKIKSDDNLKEILF